jgi:hypothetical protein
MIPKNGKTDLGLHAKQEIDRLGAAGASILLPLLLPGAISSSETPIL